MLKELAFFFFGIALLLGVLAYGIFLIWGQINILQLVFEKIDKLKKKNWRDLKGLDDKEFNFWKGRMKFALIATICIPVVIGIMDNFKKNKSKN